ncbi:hypothetical protein FACS1894166_09700 [Bacilli bacterium]|nr:hypothetical protein FACS1894166_09700 [Bacilli bacterium]
MLDNDNFTLADGVITRKNQNLPAKDYTLRFQASDNQDTITDDIVVSVIPQVVKSFHIVCDNSEMHYGHSEDTVSVSYKYAN